MRIKTTKFIWSSQGSLGPDLNNEALVEKRQSGFKIKSFSDQLREINRSRYLHDEKKLHDVEIPQKVQSTRDIGLEYAKSIRKPVLKETKSFSRLETSEARVGDLEEIEGLLEGHSRMRAVIRRIRNRHNDCVN